MLKRRQQMQESLLQQASKRRRQLEDSMQNNFKEKMKEKFLNKQVSADLRKAKKACEQLDSSKVRYSYFEIFLVFFCSYE